MKKLPYKLLPLLPLLVLTGCATGLGGMAADAGLAGAGGVVGYKVSGGKTGGAAIGAATGYIASKIAQSEYSKSTAEAEKTGYDRAMNQAVKQQYWIIQNQQKSLPADNERSPRLVPVVMPETNINGVIQNAHVEYIRLDP
ncbi:MAG TPA: hypothetical protein VMI53_04400 [Opitutaceae bacterium]|nr:hypothetical protein [Opitutaceae bacterium]